MRFIKGLFLFLLASAALQLGFLLQEVPQPVFLYENNFNSPSDIDGWEKKSTLEDDGQAEWKVDGTPSNISPSAFVSGQASLNINNEDGVYETNFRSSITSPLFSVAKPSGDLYGELIISFKCNYNTGGFSGAQDRRYIAIRGSSNTGIDQLVLHKETPKGGINPCGQEQAWHDHTATVRLERNKLDGNKAKIEFKFSSDNTFDTAQGWFIEDLKVVGSGDLSQMVGATEISSFNFDNTSLDEAGWTLASPDSFTAVWAADGNSANIEGGASHSGDKSLNYNDGSGYPQANYEATAKSPSMNITSYGRLRVSFWCNSKVRKGESVSFGDSLEQEFDKKFIRLMAGDKVLKSYRISSEYQLNSVFGYCSNFPGWHKHIGDLSLSLPHAQLAGSDIINVRLAFVFKSKVPTPSTPMPEGSYRGWYIDDLKVEGYGSPFSWSSANQLIDESFSSSSLPDGWTTQGNSSSVVWAVDATPNEIQSGNLNPAPYKSAPTSLNFNNGTNYQNENPTQPSFGIVRSSTVNTGSFTDAVLKFECRFRIESGSESGLTQDIRKLKILRAVDNSEITSIKIVKKANADQDDHIVCPDLSLWHQHYIDLDPSWGSVKVAFDFDSITQTNNGFEGWFVDDMVIKAQNIDISGPVPTQPPHVSLIVPSGTFTWVNEGGYSGAITGSVSSSSNISSLTAIIKRLTDGKYYKIENTSWQDGEVVNQLSPATGDFSIAISYETLKNGLTTDGNFKVEVGIKAVNQTGQIGSSTGVFNIDNNIPSSAIDQSGEDVSISDNSLHISGTAKDGTGESGVYAVSLKIKNSQTQEYYNQGIWQAAPVFTRVEVMGVDVSDPNTTLWHFVINGVTPETIYEIISMAKDRAGNEEEQDAISVLKAVLPPDNSGDDDDDGNNDNGNNGGNGGGITPPPPSSTDIVKPIASISTQGTMFEFDGFIRGSAGDNVGLGRILLTITDNQGRYWIPESKQWGVFIMPPTPNVVGVSGKAVNWTFEFPFEYGKLYHVEAKAEDIAGNQSIPAFASFEVYSDESIVIKPPVTSEAPKFTPKGVVLGGGGGAVCSGSIVVEQIRGIFAIYVVLFIIVVSFWRKFVC